jgi:hypothetical protein
MNMSQRRVSCFLPILGLAIACAICFSAARALAVEVLTHGTDDLYWIARVEPSPPDQKIIRTVVQMRASGAQRWRMLSKLDGRAVALANRGKDLAVLLETGQWMLLWEKGGALGQPLPNDAQVLALAGDDTALWAIGRGMIESPDAAPTTRASSAQKTVSTRAVRGIGLFEWDAQQWKSRAFLDADRFTSSAPADASMLLLSGRPVLALRESGGALRVMRLEADGKLREFGTTQASGAFKLVGASSRAVLWTSAGGPAGVLAPVELLGESPPTALAPPRDLSESDPRSITGAAGQLRLVFIHDNKLFEQAYSLSGQRSGEANALSAVETAPTDNLSNWLGIMLLVMLTLGLPRVGGSRSVSAENSDGAISIQRQKGASIAPIRLRLQAGVLDAMPVIVVSIFVASRIHTASSDEVYELIKPYWPLTTGAMVIYFLHTVIAEMLSGGKTLGKWIFGIRTVMADGSRARMMPLLIRNVSRVIAGIARTTRRSVTSPTYARRSTRI